MISHALDQMRLATEIAGDKIAAQNLTERIVVETGRLSVNKRRRNEKKGKKERKSTGKALNRFLGMAKGQPIGAQHRNLKRIILTKINAIHFSSQPVQLETSDAQPKEAVI